ncbi:hypothetical protein [Acinetobacter radioresistens]|uniref:hypothetical protein n=1 Tax=Acinetobacter radioresistens TaxID=40216 RepID=UPI002247483E|nr:hypothetical protein [Acinetobacter radioresistens]MCX0339719.1 hypothetical protein [Acinetobacter radioresistens]
MFNKIVKYSLLAISISTLLSACGGGSSDNGNSNNFTPQTFSGVAVDFYLKNATISFDNCNNVSVQTDETGKFTFTTRENCNNSALTITGGTDMGTGLPFTGTLKLKKSDFQTSAARNIVVSPLTSLDYYLTQAGQTGQLNTILTNLGIQDNLTADKLSSFDPVKDGTAHTAAATFILQQLINQAENSLKTLSNADGNPVIDQEDKQQATQIAFAAVIDVLKTPNQPLFMSNSVEINPAVMGAVVNKIVEKANTAINDPNVQLDETVVDQIKDNITAVSVILNDLLATASSGTNLLTQVQAPEIQNSLKENLMLPNYGGFKLAGYSVQQIQNSSSTAPLNLSLSNIDSAFGVDFKLNYAKSELSDNFKVGFKISGKRAGQTENLNAIVDRVYLTFNAEGTVKSATILKGTQVTLNSTLQGLNLLQITTTSDITVNNNGAISLIALLEKADLDGKNSQLKDYYNRYKAQLRTGDMLESSAFILPTNYNFDPTFNLDRATITISNKSFEAPVLTGYFKLN